MAFRARIRGAVGRAAGTRWRGGRPRTTGRIAERVARRIDGKVVVDGLTLALRPGGTAGLLGPDGSGRPTLLRLLAGVLAPTAGVVTPGVAPCPDILGLYVFTPPRRARRAAVQFPGLRHLTFCGRRASTGQETGEGRRG